MSAYKRILTLREVQVSEHATSQSPLYLFNLQVSHKVQMKPYVLMDTPSQTCHACVRHFRRWVNANMSSEAHLKELSERDLGDSPIVSACTLEIGCHEIVFLKRFIKQQVGKQGTKATYLEPLL